MTTELELSWLPRAELFVVGINQIHTTHFQIILSFHFFGVRKEDR